MTCENCEHSEVCKQHSRVYDKKIDVAEQCYLFNDREKIIELPCKIGDTIYRSGGSPEDVYEYEVEHIEIYSDGIVFIDNLDNQFTADDICEVVFLTKEEAEKAF